MANPKGIITRKDIVDDEAMKWGEVYAENIKEAVKQNNILVDSVKTLNKQVQAFKVANSQKDYITAKQAEALATQQAIDAIKKQEAAEISADKVKRSAIATMEAERKAREASEKATQRANTEKERSKKLTIEERVQNEINNKALKQEALERLGLVSAYTKLNSARTEAKNKLRDLIASESASTAEIKKAQKEFENLDGKVRKADQAVGDFTKNVGNYPFKNLASGLKDLIGAFGVTGGIAAFAGIMKGAYETIKKFDQGLADLSAITGASGKDLDFLKNSAIELGKSTKGGAIAVVEAYKLIGSAKPELLSNVNALNQVTEATLTLSKAAGMEMPEAATALTDAMNQFGADASQASTFIDALANGAKYGAAEIPQTTEALLKFGAVARSSNINIKESTALIQLLAENGIKGADAGTALRNVLLKISAPDALPKEAQKSLKDLGISFELLKDKSIPIQEKFEALKPLLADNGKLLKAFGFENVVAARNIIEHTDRLKDLTAKMGEVGTAEEQAIIRSNTLQGKTDKLSSTYDSLVLSIGSGSGAVSNFFKFFVDGSNDALNGLIRLNTSWDDLFNKAKQDGQNVGAKAFQNRFNNLSGTGSDAEIAQTVKTVAARDYKVLEAAYKKNEKALKDFNPYAIHLTGPSGKDLKLKKEELIKSLNEQAGIIRSANEKINSTNKPKVVPPTNKTNTVSEAETDSQKKERLAKQKKSNEDYLAEQKRLADSEYELKKQRLEQTIKFNDEIVADDLQSDEMRIQALYNSQQKQEDLLLLTKNHLLENEKINNEKLLSEDNLTAIDRELINKEYSIKKTIIEEDYSNKVIEINAKTKKEVEKINEFDEAKYTKDLEDKISKQNIAMNSELEAENKKFLALGDLEKMSQKDREAAIEAHEKAIFDIKKRYAIEALKLQISNLQTELTASDALPVKEQLSAEKRQKIAETLSKAKLDLSEVELSNNGKKNEKNEKSERETAQKILEISQNLTGALGNLANAIFETKISNIDAEITANDEYYSKQIELAGNDQHKKDLLTQESEKKRKKLEEEKRKEQHKQAVLNKAMSAVQIGISTAMAIMQAYAQLGPIAGTGGAIMAGVLGAIQLAAVLATPIPKYKLGRKGGPAELAYVGDGGRHEVIERANGLIQMTPATDTLVKLEQGDKVHSSVDEYLRLQKAALLTSIDMQGRKVSDFQATQFFENRNKELVEEMRLTRKAIEKNKSSVVVNTPKLDINHHLWKMKNTNWN